MEKHRTEKMQLSCYVWYIKFSESIQIKAYHVVITKLHKVKLILSNFNQSIIKIYYGPDTNSDLLKFRGNMVMLSTFQCFLTIQVQSFKVSAIGIDIYSGERRSQNNKYIEVTTLLTINLNMCEKGNFLFCLIYLTTETMYLNISLVNMTFNGPAFKDCAFGGITYFQDILSNNHSDSYKEMKTMCEDFTQESASFNKIPMDFVSAEYHSVILIYGYYPCVDDMEVNLEISPTPCKGLIPCFRDDMLFSILKCQIKYHNVNQYINS